MSKLNPQIVDQIVSNYEQGKNLDLPVLMGDARVLSCQAYYYADALGEIGKQYRMARQLRKSTFARIREEKINEGSSAAAATSAAEAAQSYKDATEQETKLDGSYSRGKRLLDAINKVLDRMSQEISDLKKEREYQRFQDAA